MTPRARARAIPPALMLASGTSMYAGAATGVLLFAYLPPAGVAWLRILGAALILLAIVRPQRHAWTGQRLILAGAFGTITALMNIAFYEAIARLPLGTAVALEFIGPILVAAWGSRGPRDVLALASAAGGVLLIADVHLAGSPLGLALALLAALLWAGYIVLGARVADAGSPRDSLAVGFAVAALVTSPLVLVIAGSWQPGTPAVTVLLLGISLGLLANVIPYGLDQVILRTAGRAYFATLLALLPVTSALIGWTILGQDLAARELIGIAAVALAVAMRRP
ncbi:EamA family transporter [Hoyosella sp. G463]|uniref:EamA family transporter n=1 Tax=Lolliginicoccus lacisalsi TaxID=2742202 RepID=A0A927JC92_9ACTN|nr:EamA family transporter [Lolliginicoccus lacisalsi]MBD8506190.1 EamA family transporter [Lolliginicoccus lacisalsi]